MIFNFKIAVFAICCNALGALAESYDYIIVGGGTAGVALSTRLSQRLPNSTILLIEAGPAAFSELNINIPGKKGSTLGTKYDWNFTTIPQTAVKNRVFAQNRGKVLGGSSALNLMTYDRATKHEYNGWEEVGNQGWNWKTMEKMMKRSENFTSADTEWYGAAGIGREGPVKGTINRFIPAHQAAWIPTMNSLGAETNKEYMGGNNLGVSYSASSIDPTHWNRSYSANAYLPLAGKNLVVWTETRVERVEFRKEKREYRAIGVTLSNGTFITANNEVILSAGSFQSPGLLEMSGIGQKSILASANITQIIDLPGVGENLQDHIRVQVSYQLKDNYTGFDILRYNTSFAAAQLQLWLEGKYSMYDYTGSAYLFETWNQSLGHDGELLSLAKMDVGNSTHPADKKKLEWMADPTIPQLEIIMSDGYTGVKGYPAPGTPLYGKQFVTFIAVIMHPFSRGNVHINPVSPLSSPSINPNYLSHPYDLSAAISALKRARQIASTAPMRDIWDNEYDPGEKVVTDEDWKQFALNTTLSIYHPSGSCSMLARKEGGVVDSRLRVYGTRGLRVVDASIMPVLISAHLQTAVYGIAEMAAEFIVEEEKSGS